MKEYEIILVYGGSVCFMAMATGMAFAYYRLTNEFKRPRKGTWAEMGVGKEIKGTGRVADMEGGSSPEMAYVNGPADRLPTAGVHRMPSKN